MRPASAAMPRTEAQKGGRFAFLRHNINNNGFGIAAVHTLGVA
jgi:hypothetical protein